jgi:hypothetical protein
MRFRDERINSKLKSGSTVPLSSEFSLKLLQGILKVALRSVADLVGKVANIEIIGHADPLQQLEMLLDFRVIIDELSRVIIDELS